MHLVGASLSLPTQAGPSAQQQLFPSPYYNSQQESIDRFNTTDVLVDPRVQDTWAAWEAINQRPSWDPAVAYGTSIAAALEEQESDFYIGENPWHPTHMYKHNLQQDFHSN